MNMSYCRFRNTNIALGDCLETLREEDDKLSKNEWLACKDMFKQFIDFCYNEDIIQEDDIELDARLTRYLNKFKED